MFTSPSVGRRSGRALFSAAVVIPIALGGVLAGTTQAQAAAGAPPGWTVVQTAVMPRTHTVTVALIAPQGTEPSFTVDDARASVTAAADYLAAETDGALTLASGGVDDWRRMPDDTPCSWSGALQDFASSQNGWTWGDRKHLTVMVPTGDPCPNWANGHQGDWFGSGGRTFQPGTDADTLVHELGHNMSLPHAFSIQCAAAWDFSTLGAGVPAGCDRQEYGNQLDVMGGAWWMFAPFASPQLDRLGMLPKRYEPQCGKARRITMNATGQGAAGRTAVSWLDPADPNARYWVDFRAVRDAQKYKYLIDSPWAFAPSRAGLQILRTDPNITFGTTVLARPGDTSDLRQLTAVNEKVSLHGGASVRLVSVAADGASGVVEVSVPC